MSRGGRLRATVVSLAALVTGLALASPATAAAATPSTPIDLFNGYRFCSTDVNSPTYLSSSGGVLIEGLSPETDSSTAPITEQFQVWPTGDSTQTTTYSDQHLRPGDEGSVQVPAGDLSDGQTYAWRAQAVGTDGASEWSASCYFRVDATQPSSAPAITSSNYPEGQWDQGGAPIQITLGANGAGDVEGYVFSWHGAGGFPVPGADIGAHGIPAPRDPYANTAAYVRASALGGPASLNLIPPSGGGPMTLTVASLDRAYNRSPVATYTITVTSTDPTIELLTPDPEFGGWASFLLQPDPGLQAASPVVGYTVKFSGETDKTIDVTASADGTGHVRVKLDGIWSNSLTVTSKSASGWVSGNAIWSRSFDTTPTVGSDAYPENQSSGGVGVPGTFTFTPKVKHIVSYTYSFNYGTPVTVNAGQGHAATVGWTPDQSGFTDLEVYATTEDGLQLTPYDYFFSVS
jgi:hypothetical protein